VSADKMVKYIPIFWKTTTRINEKCHSCHAIHMVSNALRLLYPTSNPTGSRSWLKQKQTQVK